MNDRKPKYSQASMPLFTLREALEIARSLSDNYAGRDATPIDLAKSIGRSPTSSAWRALTSAGVAYGLTAGTFNASMIALAPLGRRIVAPAEEGDDRAAILSSLLTPTILKEFYEKYDGNKLPKEDIAKNVLLQMGVPQERIQSAYKIIVENAQFAGILSNINGNMYIQLRVPSLNESRMHAPRADEIESNMIRSTPVQSMKLQDQETDLNLVTIPVIHGELGIAISPSMQGKIWLNPTLTQKFQKLTDAARELAGEWSKIDGKDE